jgi:two-component system LytT family sensor kinase
MYLPGKTRPPWWHWSYCAIFLGVWGLLGLFEATHSCIVKAYKGEAVDWQASLALNLALWYAWAPLALLAIAFVYRFPIRKNNWWHRLPLALALAILLAFAKIAPDWPIIMELYCPDPEWVSLSEFYRMGFASHFQQYVLFAIGMLGVLYALNYFREYQQRELDAWQLEARLAKARLQVLRMQLHPHFLFNTLHAVGHLIRTDAAEAERVLVRLGELLRLMLDTAGEQQVPLRQELDFLRAYLDIERVRYGARLEVRMDVEPGLLEAAVPPLILQPLVENAVLHGPARAGRAGRVEIRARRAGDAMLRLEVWDDGPGLGHYPSAGSGKSIGLANTRARLAQLFDGRHRFEIGNAAVGVLAVMEFPLGHTPPAVSPPARAARPRALPPAERAPESSQA